MARKSQLEVFSILKLTWKQTKQKPVATIQDDVFEYIEDHMQKFRPYCESLFFTQIITQHGFALKIQLKVNSSKLSKFLLAENPVEGVCTQSWFMKRFFVALFSLILFFA